MSKQRPSPVFPAETLPDRAGRDRSEAYWRRRVFKNSYTRGGRRLRVKGWSVKLQHLARRRTFSLTGPSRQAAAREARALHQTLLHHGWESLRPLPGGGPGKAAVPRAGNELESWKQRLVRRHYPSEGLNEWSVRIEHAGIRHYFPLQNLDADQAAQRARRIHQTVVRRGWARARQRFPRELTLALHWTDNPVAWTYATFYSLVGRTGAPAREGNENPRGLRVAVADSEPDVRRALQVCVGGQRGFCCAGTFATLREALEISPPAQLVLWNLSLAEPVDSQRPRAGPANELAMIPYSIHEDSDQLFRATPGGAAGYLLKRTSCDRLFEPIADLTRHSPLTRELVAQQVRRYFQKVIHSLSSEGVGHELAKLTARENEILNLLSKGILDKEIAEELKISVWTVHGHLKRIFEKLGVHTRTEAAVAYLHK